MAVPRGVEVTNLTETVQALQELGADFDTIRTTLTDIAGVVAAEAETLAPRRSGALAGSLRVSAPFAPGRNITELELVSDSPYAKNFHESAIRGVGASTYYWFSVPAHTRRNTPNGVSSYVAIRRLPNAPFMIQAVERKQEQAGEMVSAALDAMLAEWGSD